MTPKFIKIASEKTLELFNLCKSDILKLSPQVKNLTDEKALAHICQVYINKER